MHRQRRNDEIRSRVVLGALLVLLALVGGSGSATAGVGSADSPPALLDTRNPVLTLTPVPEHLVLHAGEDLVFSWTSSDDNPGQNPDDYQAAVVIAGQVDSSLTWYPQTEGFTWGWTAPEVQSALCRLEVVVKDVMGNTTTGVSDYFTVLYSTTPAADLPDRLQLGAPTPNPFNPSCRLEFQLPWTGPATFAVHDVRGHRVRLLESGVLAAGAHTLRWDGTDDRGRPQPGGLYFFVLEVRTPQGDQRLTRRAVLIP